MIRETAVLGLALVSLTACGGSGTAEARPTATVTVTQTVTAQPSIQQGVVPNVVGMNHQLAQDTMQAAGYYYLTEVDATGKGRLLIIDRDWVVVSQQPAGGTKADPGTKIVLRSKKIGE